MEGYKWIGVIGTIFIGLTIINGILGGVFVSSSDVAILNNVGLSQKVDIGFMTLSVPNANFLTGLKHMVTFDYSFFGGMGQFIVFALYPISFMVFFALFVMIISAGLNALRPR